MKIQSPMESFTFPNPGQLLAVTMRILWWCQLISTRTCFRYPFAVSPSLSSFASNNGRHKTSADAFADALEPTVGSNGVQGENVTDGHEPITSVSCLVRPA